MPTFYVNDIASRDGQRHRIAWSNTLLRDSVGQIVGTASIGQDVTELEQSRRKERLYQEKIIQSEKMATLGILASGVAHEINNPNNFIMMNAEIFARAWMDMDSILERFYNEHGRFSLAGMPYDKARSRFPALIDGLIDGARRIQSIVADLKEYALPESALIKEPVDVNRVLLSVVKLTRPLLQRSSNKFMLQTANDIPSVYGSVQKLEQLFINLIKNACQALTDPTQAISIRSEADPSGQQLIVSIADQGRGIDAESLKHVFDPFFTTRRTSGGTGLGLSICQRIVADHGGTLELVSQVGSGTTATVVLPAAAFFPEPGPAFADEANQ
jgi:signal transduction histidine kinase